MTIRINGSDKGCPQSGLLHVLFSPRAEGCPRLALDLIRQEQLQMGRRASVAFCVRQPGDFLGEFRSVSEGVYDLGWRRRGYYELFRNTYRLLKTIRPSGIICYPLGQHVPISAAARLLGIGTVLHVATGPPLSDESAVRKLKAQITAGRPFVMAHAACSEHVAQRCIDTYGLPKRVVTAVPNGIAIDTFDKRREKRTDKLKTGTITIGMVGNLEHSKDHISLLKALCTLRGRGVEARLHLIGDGSQRNLLREVAADLGVFELVRWAGSVSDVGSELKEMDVFAYAVYPNEGLGIALVEALVAGLPVVASDVPACREVLQNGRWGALVAGRDPEAWANALSNAATLSVPTLGDLSHYDIRETFRVYARLLGTAV